MNPRYAENLRRRQALQDEGLCIDCACAVEESPVRLRCADCRKHASAMQAKRREKAKTKGAAV